MSKILQKCQKNCKNTKKLTFLPIFLYNMYKNTIKVLGVLRYARSRFGKISSRFKKEKS